jgi:RNA polymerase sigma-70 factor (ECF subfamily)
MTHSAGTTIDNKTTSQSGDNPARLAPQLARRGSEAIITAMEMPATSVMAPVTPIRMYPSSLSREPLPSAPAQMSSSQRIKDLLPQAQLGSREALGEVLQACRLYLVMIAESELDPELRGKGGASDLVQQTFLEAQQDFGRFHGTTSDELRAWLRHILLNNVSNFARAYRETAKRNLVREVRLPARTSGEWFAEPASTAKTPSQQFRAQQEEAELQRALERLPIEYQQVIRYRYQDELSFEEIAARLDRSPPAARKLWSRAIESLRAAMDSRDIEEPAP